MPSKFPPRKPGNRMAECRECGWHRDDGADISARGLCQECRVERAVGSADQLRARSGPFYDQWCASMIDVARSLAAGR